MDATHFNELAYLDRSYWWFMVRFRLAIRLLCKEQPLKDFSLIVDWGCGTAGFLEYLRDVEGVPTNRLLGFEPSSYAHNLLKTRGIACRHLIVNIPIKDQLPSTSDAIFILDVLEHVINPVSIMKELQNAAAPGAKLVVMVPAFQHLWSIWDERIGHKRRYNRNLLEKQITQAGWRIKESQYFFSGLYPIALIRQYLIRLGQISENEFPRVSTRLNNLFYQWFQRESKFSRLPFGTSVAALAQKPL